MSSGNEKNYKRNPRSSSAETIISRIFAHADQIVAAHPGQKITIQVSIDGTNIGRDWMVSRNTQAYIEELEGQIFHLKNQVVQNQLSLDGLRAQLAGLKQQLYAIYNWCVHLHWVYEQGPPPAIVEPDQPMKTSS
jgi:hypothetical protein